MTITFYTFSKRRNSTRQPSGGTGYTGTLTAESGIISPTVIMDFGNTAPTYNYAYITEFNRYYWITEITSIGGGLWRVSMRSDAMASFKSAIGAANKYILRAASESDGDITDIKYPTKAGFTSNVSSVASGWAADPMLGRYVVGVVSPGGAFGSVQMFCLDNFEFAALRQAIAPSTYYNDINDTDLKNLAITICNPMQYIAWVKYYPFAVPQGAVDTMQLGNIPIQNMHTLGAVTFTQSYSFSFTDHPGAATRGAYLNCEPFTHRYLSWFPVGMVHIPGLSAKLTGIQVYAVIDVMSGTADLIIRDTSIDNTELYRTAFSVGVDVPVAQVVSGNPLKIVSGAVSFLGAGTSAMLGNIAGTISSGISGIMDFISSTVPEVQAYKPGSGSLISDPSVRLVEYFSNIVDDDYLEFGRPLCKVRAISSLSGFVLCATGDIYAVGAYDSELAEIESYLTGGFYYE